MRSALLSKDEQKIEALSDIEVLALTLMGEARGEPIEGQVAVASVIRNRLIGMPSKYKSYHDVCLEPNQFSCWSSNDTNYGMLIDLCEQLIAGHTLTDPVIQQCFTLARGIIDNSIMDNTKRCMFYLANWVIYQDKTPNWAKSRRNEVVKGNQTFFNI